MSVYEPKSDNRSMVIQTIKADHPEGTIVTVIRSSQLFNPIIQGAVGMVKFVDRTGSIHIDVDGRTVTLNYFTGDRWRIEG